MKEEGQIMNWRKYFDTIIYLRGWDYYRDGAVGKLEYLSERSFQTTVIGTRRYRVKVQFDEKRLLYNFECDCPYFERDGNCKHLAAALMKWEEQHATNPHDSQESTEDEYSPEALKNGFKWIRRAYASGDDFVSYWQAQGFAGESISLLREATDSLMRTGQLHEAFEASVTIVNLFLNTPMDDDGEVADFCDSCLAVWDEIYAVNDLAMQEQMFEWLNENFDFDVTRLHFGDAYQSLIHTFWTEHFNTEDFLARKLEIINRKISECQQTKDSEVQLCIMNHECEEWLLSKAQLLKSVAKSSEEIEKFYQGNSSYERLQMDYVDWLITQDSHEKAFAILEALMKKTKDELNHPFLCRKLLPLCEKLGKIETKEECLRELVKTGRNVEQDYAELRTMYNQADWQKTRVRVIESIPDVYRRAILWEKEGMLAELKDEILARHSLGLLERHSDVLVNEFPNEILQEYETLLDIEMANASSRNKYCEIVCILQHINALPGGRDLAQKLVAQWRNNYSRRKAMLEELARV